MNSYDKRPPSEKDRRQEVDRQAKKARRVLGNLDFIDDLPDPPRRVEIPNPYDTSGAPRPYGWDIWR